MKGVTSYTLRAPPALAAFEGCNFVHGRNTLPEPAPPQVPDTTRHCAAPRVQVIFAPQTRQFFHQRVTLTTTGKCVMEMRTPPGNGLHPRRSLYFVPKTNVERARNSSALPALIATYDVQLHKVLLRQPTDFRRQINARQYFASREATVILLRQFLSCDLFAVRLSFIWGSSSRLRLGESS